MVCQPEIAVLVSSFERPRHLLRVLHSIAVQRGVDDKFEVVVTDDGSQDETLSLVDRFAKEQTFPVGVTTHMHETFQLARCRNEGVRASTAPYLLFLDGDCLIPPDHLRVHLERKQKKVAYAGYCALLDRTTTESLDIDDVRAGRFMKQTADAELKKTVEDASQSTIL